jgi:hypothetical protein
LNPNWLHDLHKGVFNEYQYMQMMLVNVVHGRLWGDFTTIKWVSDYLQRPFYIWSNEIGRIINKQGCEFELEPLHLAFGSNHFQPIEELNQSIPIILPRENRDIEIINLESDVSYEQNSLDSHKTWMQKMS